MNNRYRMYKDRQFIGFCGTLKEGKFLIKRTAEVNNESIVQIENGGKIIYTTGTESKVDGTIEYYCYIIERMKKLKVKE